MVVNPDIQGERDSCCEMLWVLQMLMMDEYIYIHIYIYNELQTQKPLVEPGSHSLKTQRVAAKEKIRGPSYDLTKPGG